MYIAADTVFAHHFAQQNRATVTELRGETTELVT